MKDTIEHPPLPPCAPNRTKHFVTPHQERNRHLRLNAGQAAPMKINPIPAKTRNGGARCTGEREGTASAFNLRDTSAGADVHVEDDQLSSGTHVPIVAPPPRRRLAGDLRPPPRSGSCTHGRAPGCGGPGRGRRYVSQSAACGGRPPRTITLGCIRYSGERREVPRLVSPSQMPARRFCHPCAVKGCGDERRWAVRQHRPVSRR